MKLSITGLKSVVDATHALARRTIVIGPHGVSRTSFHSASGT